MVKTGRVQQALAGHKKAGMKLGQYMVRKGIVSESDMVNALADQLKLEVYKPSRHAVDPELAKIIPFELANKYQVAPIEIDGQLLRIVMTDPLDIRALDKIEDTTRLEAEELICTEQHLIQLHKCLYGSFTDIGDIIEGIDEVTIGEDPEKSAEAKDVDLNILQGMAEKAPVVVLVNSIIFQAVQEGASDVHISPQKNVVRVRFRVDGKLHEVPSPPKRCFLPIVSRLKILAGMDIAVSRKPQDGRFNVRMKNRDINVRASTIPSIYGENVVLRLLDTSNGIYSLDHLGMSDPDRIKLEAVTARPHGMILSTGPTGSGKSTSLYAILKTINQPDLNIVTIEDPVE
ncbi:MAG: ATPase, T2SS/T4P/T4SS family, partial [Deltaproteobacteria bacterium]